MDNSSSVRTIVVAVRHGVRGIVKIDKYLSSDALIRGAFECAGEELVR